MDFPPFKFYMMLQMSEDLDVFRLSDARRDSCSENGKPNGELIIEIFTKKWKF